MTINLTQDELYQLVYDNYTDLDADLVKYNLWHKEFRQYCYRNKLAMPPLTVGLKSEVLGALDIDNQGRFDKQSVRWPYRLTVLELNRLLYHPLPAPLTATEINARRARAAGMTEEDITHRYGHECVDLTRRRTEILAQLPDTTATDLAHRYGISVAAITYMKPAHARRRKTSYHIKLAIIAEYKEGASVEALAKKYNKSKRTIYRCLENT